LASDQAQEMTRVASERVRDRHAHFKNANVEIATCSAENIARLASDQKLDGAFSNFGVLNCVESLRDFALQLTSCLRPGAPVLISLLGPCCLWEVAWFLAHGDPRRATRRFGRGGVQARLSQGSTFTVHYPTVRSVKNAFAPHFRLTRVKGIGIAVPPSYAAGWAPRYPNLWRVVTRADRKLAKIPGVRVLADHVLLQFEKVSA
jgi:hypothetical protein